MQIPKKQLKFKNQDGVEYTIVFKKIPKKYNASGLCDDPKSKKPQIWVDPTLNNKRILEVVSEEFFHMSAWDKNEKTARKFAANLAKCLIAIGFKISD